MSFTWNKFNHAAKYQKQTHTISKSTTLYKDNYTVSQKKHETTFSKKSWTKNVRLQRFLAHLLLRL